MIYKDYGKKGLKVSAVGFGGMRFDTKRPMEENAELLLYARECGINYLDTAPAYCEDQSETIFGMAIEQLGADRDKVYVSTKAMPESVDGPSLARQAVERSLERLKTDYIDFYHIWCIRKWSHYELAMKPGGQYEELLRCKEDGLIKHVVISTHLQGPQVRTIVEDNKCAGILLGVNILNNRYRWEGVQAAHDAGWGVVAMNPLAGGVIPQNQADLAFLAKDGETPVEAALRFCISCPEITVTLAGMTTKEHVDQACKVADQSEAFAADELDRINENLSKEMDSVCTGCGYCMSSCPVNIPISAYMQIYNLRKMFNKSDEDMIRKIKDEHQWLMLADRQADAVDCTACGACEEVCTQHLDIIERLAVLAKLESSLD